MYVIVLYIEYALVWGRKIKVDEICKLEANSKKHWGESSGYQQYLRERNKAMKEKFNNGSSMESLMEEYSLSYDSIKRIVYNKKEENIWR